MKQRMTTHHPRFARPLRLASLIGLVWALGASAQAQQTITGKLPGPSALEGAPTIATNNLVRLIEVSPKLPPYRFVLKPDAWSDKPHPAPDEHIGQMSVFKGASDVVEQLIEVVGIDPSWLTNSFDAIDINMDGFQDVRVLYQVGGKWGSHSYWLFDPDSGRFVTNALTADLRTLEHNGLTLNPQSQELRTSHFIGMCLKSYTIYRIENGRLVLMESEIHDPRDSGLCLVETQKRVNGELVLIKSELRKHEDSDFSSTAQ